MWSSESEENTNSNNNKKVVSSSSSKSSSSSSSSSYSPFSTISSLLPNPRRKTMEEVWKDIGFTSLNDHPTRKDVGGGLLPRTNHHSTFIRGMNLQEFLARPFNKEPPTGGASSTTSAGDVRLFAPLPPPPATVLCLNSGSDEFQYLDNNSDHPFQVQPNSSLGLTCRFDAFGSSPPLPNFCKRRVPEIEDNSGDRQHKRMIKNRESAARSRARKQAYTNELELKLKQLRQENERLQNQQKQLYLGAPAQLPKKHTLHRTSTAPF